MIKAKNHICPRCGGSVPNKKNKGKYPGAVSRIADYEICSDCGLDEALRAYSKKPALKVESWNFMSNS